MRLPDKKNICIVGCGYVGLALGLCFAYFGNTVKFVDKNKKRLEMLRKGQMPFFEPQIERMLKLTRKDVKFYSRLNPGIKDVEIIFISVGTPARLDGSIDNSQVENVIEQVLQSILPESEALIVIKSTVPIGTTRNLAFRLKEMVRETSRLEIAVNPEFLREGTSIFDMLYPDRVVFGCSSQKAERLLKDVYEPILLQDFSPPDECARPKAYGRPALLVTDTTTAELIKFANNAFLAMKISFINEMAAICEKAEADIRLLSKGVGLDKRIGPYFLQAGIGWGGSCLGKDTSALVGQAESLGIELLLVKGARKVNENLRDLVINKLEIHLKGLKDKTIGILGLSFKPNTDDLRDAPSLNIINGLLSKGVVVKAYDPVAMDTCASQHPEMNICYAENLIALATRCDALLLATEWEEFKTMPLEEMAKVMHQRIFLDGRNFLESSKVRAAGFVYLGIGC